MVLNKVVLIISKDSSKKTSKFGSKQSVFMIIVISLKVWLEGLRIDYSHARKIC